MTINAAKKPDEIEYYGPEPIQFENVVIGVERMVDILLEAQALHALHWTETEEGYTDEQFSPDYEQVLQAEKCGRLVATTVRSSNGALVGINMFFINRSASMLNKIVAQEHGIYLTKDYRSRGIAVAWIAYMKDVLKNAGMDYMVMCDKSPVGGKSLKNLFEFSGLRQFSVEYMVKLGE